MLKVDYDSERSDEDDCMESFACAPRAEMYRDFCMM